MAQAVTTSRFSTLPEEIVREVANNLTYIDFKAFWKADPTVVEPLVSSRHVVLLRSSRLEGIRRVFFRDEFLCLHMFGTEKDLPREKEFFALPIEQRPHTFLKLTNEVVSAAIQRGNFDRFPDLQLEENVVEVFRVLAQTRDVTLLRVFMDSSSFKEIDPDHFSYAAMQTFRLGYEEVSDVLMSSRFFNEMTIEEWGVDFINYAKGGEAEAVKVFTRSLRFIMMNLDDLETALQAAVEGRHVAVLQAIMHCHRFGDVGCKCLNDVFGQAILEDSREIIHVFIECSRFKEICVDRLATTLNLAIQKGDKALVDALLASPCFGDVKCGRLLREMRHAELGGHIHIAKAIDSYLQRRNDDNLPKRRRED